MAVEGVAGAHHAGGAELGATPCGRWGGSVPHSRLGQVEYALSRPAGRACRGVAARALPHAPQTAPIAAEQLLPPPVGAALGPGDVDGRPVSLRPRGEGVLGDGHVP